MTTFEKGPLFVVVGPSASGKSSLVKCACEVLGLRRAVTSTTRKRRPGEDSGAYHFLSEETFASQVYLEHVEYAGHYYGLSVSEAACSDIVITDANGASAIQAWAKISGRPVIVIVLQCRPDTMRTRMRKRGDSLNSIRQRMDFYVSIEQKDLEQLDSDFRLSADEDFPSVAAKFTQLIQYCREAALRR